MLATFFKKPKNDIGTAKIPVKLIGWTEINMIFTESHQQG
jgi:hypothetical protein